MKVYKIVNNDFDGEPVFGLPYPFNETNGEKKLNQLFGTIKPWTHCIPYYKKSKFAFISKNALLTFLFGNKNIELTYEDIKELMLAGWKVISFELNTWSDGLSKFMCTYFNDEIADSEIETYTFDELFNIKYDKVTQDNVPKSDIRDIKEKYYNDVKTYYDFN